MLHFRYINYIIYLGGDNMKNKFMKILRASLFCLTLSLLLNIIAYEDNSKIVVSTIHTDELAPWG